MASRCAFPSLRFGSFTLPSLTDLLLILVLGFTPPSIPLPSRPDFHADVPPLPGGTLAFGLPTLPSLTDLLALFLLPFDPPPLPFGFSIRQPSVPGLDALLALLLGFIDLPELPEPYCFLDDEPE
jgi:hypothetical protein